MRVLGADGVILLANTHGEYLGAPEHEPLLAELNPHNAEALFPRLANPGR